ncbi:alpha/beta-hydrolase family protein [Antrihabitans sp. YC2-6]|uniref:alpha/beta-hydrolase family protein n=1 Tax=Antrihabitans sp. YC2-6 TaxID=2799498 RepID=UPI0027DB975A|nr:alpha/beta-hydrolase family protein [Antrihabitans sp. YC2-6]
MAVTLLAAISLAPGLLPRSAPLQAVLTGVLVTFGVACAGVAGRFLGARRKPGPARAAVAALGAIGIGWSVVAADRWQDGLRSAMDMPPVGPAYWLEVVAGASLIVAVLYGCSVAVAWFVRRLGPLRCAAVLVVAGLAAWFVAIPAVVDSRQAAYRTSSALLDSAVVQPLSSNRSGSPRSFAAWETLGAEGRKFVASGSDVASVRVYAGIDSAPDLNSRVALAIRELERSGGLLRSNVVVAIPTGSGWIDSNAVTGFERRFADDVAVVGVQYSYAPSWATFLFGRAESEAAAQALYTAVAARIAAIPADQRPKLYIYGQSLGSVGGAAALHARAGETCGALWAGPPAGSVDTTGATVLANSSDPVVRWSPSLLFEPPALDHVRVDAPAPQWLPVVSFVQTTVDLLGALDAPAGHGHRYGTDQGTALTGCA